MGQKVSNGLPGLEVESNCSWVWDLFKVSGNVFELDYHDAY